jgi:hypothetical protein
VTGLPLNWEKDKEKRKGAEGSNTGIIGLACHDYLYDSLADRTRTQSQEKKNPNPAGKKIAQVDRKIR